MSAKLCVKLVHRHKSGEGLLELAFRVFVYVPVETIMLNKNKVVFFENILLLY